MENLAGRAGRVDEKSYSNVSDKKDIQSSNNTLFENKQIQIKYIDNSILHYKLIGYVDLKLIQIFDKEFVEYIRKTREKKIITKTRDMKMVSTEAQCYSGENINPAWNRLGIEYNAIIIPSNAFGQLASQVLSNIYESQPNGDGSKKKYHIFNSYSAGYFH
jgi:hypothetical protein